MRNLPQIHRSNDEQILALYADVTKQARRKLGGRNIGSVDADDVSQQAILELLQIPEDRRIHNPCAYSKGVVRNLLHAASRREKVSRRRPLDDVALPFDEDRGLSDPISALFQRIPSLICKQDRRVLDQLLSGQFHWSEMATFLGTTLQAVYRSMSRIREAVRITVFADSKERVARIKKAADPMREYRRHVGVIEEYASLFTDTYRSSILTIRFGEEINDIVWSKDSDWNRRRWILDILHLADDVYGRLNEKLMLGDNSLRSAYYSARRKLFEDYAEFALPNRLDIATDEYLTALLFELLYIWDWYDQEGETEPGDYTLDTWLEKSVYFSEIFGRSYVESRLDAVSKQTGVEVPSWMT